MLIRRLALVVSIVFCGSLALAAAAVAAGGLGPGKFTFDSSAANAFFGMGKKGGPPAPSWQVSVNQGLNSFKPTDPPEPRIVINSSMVFLAEFDATGNGGFGCFVVPNADFTVGRDLQSAALHTRLTAAEACPGFATPVGGSEDVVFAGGNGGLVLPITVDVTWTAMGAVTTFNQTFSVQCLDFKVDGNSTNLATGAGATGTISALPGQFNSGFADVKTSVGKLDISGTLETACLRVF